MTVLKEYLRNPNLTQSNQLKNLIMSSDSENSLQQSLTLINDAKNALPLFPYAGFSLLLSLYIEGVFIHETLDSQQSPSIHTAEHFFKNFVGIISILLSWNHLQKKIEKKAQLDSLIDLINGRLVDLNLDNSFYINPHS